MDTIYKIPDVTIEAVSIDGQGLKNILIVVREDQYLKNELATLQLIIKAIHLDFENDIKVLKLLHHQKLSLTPLINDYQDIIIFGLQPSDLGFFVEYQPYEVLQFETKRMLVADALTELNVSKTKKGLLWTKLKAMYNIQ